MQVMFISEPEIWFKSCKVMMALWVFLDSKPALKNNTHADCSFFFRDIILNLTWENPLKRIDTTFSPRH